MSIRLALVSVVVLIPFDGSCKSGPNEDAASVAVKISRTSLARPQHAGRSRV